MTETTPAGNPAGPRLSDQPVTVPATINRRPVVAAVRLDDSPGLVRNGHIVVCQNDDGTYLTWIIGRENDRWSASTGHYSLSWSSALVDMIERAQLWESGR